MREFLRSIFVSCMIGLVAACGGGGGGDDDGSGGGGAGSGSDSNGLATRCGVITDGDLYNPIAESRGEPVQLVEVLDSNAVVVSNGSEQRLVKLQGIGGTTGFRNTAAEQLYAELAAHPLVFFEAGGCTGTVDNGQTGTVGSIVNSQGVSFAEELIAKKYAGVIETTGNCGESSLTACYQNISATNEHHAYGPPRACSTMPSYIRYNPSDTTSCGGNASLTVNTDEFGSVFSIQLRYPDGTDRIVEDCEVASCTPLKVQGPYQRSDSQVVACFGAPGNSVALSDVNHTSIKRESDDGDPPRYCIPDPTVAVN